MGQKLIKPFIVIVIVGLLLVGFQNCNQSGFKVDGSAEFGSESENGEDLFYPYAWHLENTGQKVFASSGGVKGMDLNLQKTWMSGYYGEGVKVLISDDGVESNHEDLSGNWFNAAQSRNYALTNWLSASAPPLASSDFHGMGVAGLVAAVGWNKKGSRGVAPKAKMIATNFMSNQISKSSDIIVDQAKGDVDIINMSWGYSQSNYTSIDDSFRDQLKYAVENGRNGKGILLVKSSGNSRVETVARLGTNVYRPGFSVFDGMNNTPYTFNVGAYLATGIVTSYSSPGSNLWVSAPGGLDGIKSPAIVTTDRSGCVLGLSASTVSDTHKLLGSGFLTGGNGNSGCNYNVIFNGTSSAAPTVSGSLALLLQSQPNLTWRDVKYILAKTSTVTAYDFDENENYLYSLNPSAYASLKSPTGYQWENNWVVNSAGFSFSNLYGFGRINVDKAVDFAKSYSSLFTSPLISETFDSATISMSVPDNSKDGASHTLNVNKNIKIEAIQVIPYITHNNLGELAIELWNPQGQRSVVVPMNNSLDGTSNYAGYTLLVNQFFQESSLGDWTIKVIDGRAGTIGTLTRWKIVVYGQQQ